MDEAGENRKKTQPLMTNVQLIMQVFEEIIQINGHCYPIVCFSDVWRVRIAYPHPQILTCEKEIVACCSTPATIDVACCIW